MNSENFTKFTEVSDAMECNYCDHDHSRDSVSEIRLMNGELVYIFQSGFNRTDQQYQKSLVRYGTDIKHSIFYMCRMIMFGLFVCWLGVYGYFIWCLNWRDVWFMYSCLILAFLNMFMFFQNVILPMGICKLNSSIFKKHALNILPPFLRRDVSTTPEHAQGDHSDSRKSNKYNKRFTKSKKPARL